jgi:hypothetical protein
MLACLRICLFVCLLVLDNNLQISIFPYAGSVGFVKSLDEICSVLRGTLFRHKNLLGISKSRYHLQKKN